jgi:hypothetical protein
MIRLQVSDGKPAADVTRPADVIIRSPPRVALDFYPYLAGRFPEDVLDEHDEPCGRQLDGLVAD